MAGNGPGIGAIYDEPVSPVDVTRFEPAGTVLKDPLEEYIVGGPAAGFFPRAGYLIAEAIDDVVQQFGPWVYELMRVDPAIYGSLSLLIAGVLGDGPQVVPAIVPEDGEEVEQGSDRAREIELAAEIAAYWQRSVDGLSPGFDQVLWEYCDEFMCGGCTLAEPSYRMELDPASPDRGRKVLDHFQVKPRWAWGMRVDPFMRVHQIRAWTVRGWMNIDRRHVALASWQPRKGDPRGTRILRAAYPAWNLKLQAIPDYGEYLRLFGRPVVAATGGENQESIMTTDPVTGRTVETTVPQQMLRAAQQAQRLGAIGLAYGGTVHLMQSQGNGEAFLKGFDWCDREMFRSIILGTRPMQEAQHSSKADAEAGKDLVTMAVLQARKPLVESIRKDLFYWGTVLNWGKPIADRLTPHLGFGAGDAISPALLLALTNAWDKGVFQVPQRPWLLKKLGAPQDPPGYQDELAAQQQADQQGQQQGDEQDQQGQQDDQGASQGNKPPTSDDNANPPTPKRAKPKRAKPANPRSAA